MAYNVEMSPSSANPNARAGTPTEPELLQTLQANTGRAIVVTSTVRAARGLRQRYNQWQHACGNTGWVTPEILSWEPWLETLWNAAVLCGAETRVLLSEVQELELWRKVLANDDAARQTLSIDALAELAQRAWRQMHQYRIPLNKLHSDISVDAKAFYRWATEFEKVCRKSSFLSPALVETAIAQWIPSHEIQLPEEIFLLGFDRVTPSQTLLIDAFNGRACSVHFVELRPADVAASNLAIVYSSTLEEEIASAANWMRHALLASPAQRIGVIVPALEALRGSIDAIFRRILAPSAMDIRVQRASLPYEFSLGTSMHRLQPIRTALTLLRWLQGPISAEEISWLVVHGDFSHAFPDDRAKLDRRFRERDFQLGGPVALSAFRQWLSGSGSREGSPEFRRIIERIFAAAARSDLEKPRLFAEWRETIEEMLDAAEWRLLASVNSADYQLLRRWNALLNDLSSLNTIAGPTQFSQVVAKLQHFAANMLFTLETKNVPVQILGVSESAGLTFDAVWWMNAQARDWPSRGKAQPFLPWNLQREAHMPYTEPAEDYAFALRTTKRILDSGKTVVVSFALQGSDAADTSAHIPDREIVLSPLIREALPNTAINPAEEFFPMHSEPRPSYSEIGLEQICEEPAVPFPATRVRGGVRFLELHAACPFRAFAELRLGTRPLAEIGTGLSPNAQGSIIHRVLDQFWKEMKSRKNLLESTREQHGEILRGHIHTALAEFFQHANEPWQEALLEIEAERLEQRLLLWLEQEKLRPDFTVLKTEDTLDHPQIAGIELQCRVDRIDQVEQGIVLLDYKTGPVDRGSCEGDRPDQPQLPAYAILRNQVLGGEDLLAGVAFAGLHPRQIGFTVVGSLPSVFEASPALQGESNVAPQSKSRWNLAALTPEEMRSLQEIWSASLTRLAEEFRTGAARVDPKKKGETCKYCAQTLLCRIRETSAAVEVATEEGTEGASSTGIFAL